MTKWTSFQITNIVLLSVITALIVWVVLIKPLFARNYYGQMKEMLFLTPDNSLDSLREQFAPGGTESVYLGPLPESIPVAYGNPGPSYDSKHPFKVKRNSGKSAVFRPIKKPK